MSRVNVAMFPQEAAILAGVPSVTLYLKPGCTTAGHLLVQIANDHEKLGAHIHQCSLTRLSDGAVLTGKDELVDWQKVALHLIPPVGSPIGGTPNFAAPRVPALFDIAGEQSWSPPPNWPPPLPPISVLRAGHGTAYEAALEGLRVELPCKAGAAKWCLPGSVLVGPSPADEDDVALILGLGVRTFIDLRRVGEGADYRHVAQALHSAWLERDVRARSPSYLAAPLEFIACPVPAHIDPAAPPVRGDHGCAADPVIAKLALDLVKRAADGGIIYIHCSMGHGRTGTLSALIMGLAYGLDWTHALHLFQALHDLGGNTFSQREVARDLSHSFSAADSKQARQPPSGPIQYTDCRDCPALLPPQRDQLRRLLAPDRSHDSSRHHVRAAAAVRRQQECFPGMSERPDSRSSADSSESPGEDTVRDLPKSARGAPAIALALEAR